MGIIHKELGDYERALAFYQKTLDVDQIVFPERENADPSTIYNMANVYSENGNLEKAIELYTEVLEILNTTLPQDHIHFNYPLHSLGMAYLLKKDYSSSLEYCQKALRVLKKNLGEEHMQIARVYETIAMNYQQQKEFDLAFQWYEKSLLLETKLLGKESRSLGSTYLNLSSFFNQREQYEQALYYGNQALRIYTNKESNPYELAQVYENIGLLHKKQNEFRSAIENIQQAISIYEEQLQGRRDYPKLGTAFMNLSSCYEEMDNLDQSLKYIQQSLFSFFDGFEDDNVYVNPKKETIRDQVHVLEPLWNKAFMLHERFDRTGEKKDLLMAYSTNLLAIEIIDSLKYTQRRDSAKLLVSVEYQKMYEFGIRMCLELFDLTHDFSYVREAIYFFEKSRNTILSESLAKTNAETKLGIPARIREKEAAWNRELALYEKLIYEEFNDKPNPNQLHISTWRDYLFMYHQQLDSLAEILREQYPAYYQLKYEQEVSNVQAVQTYLKTRPETAVIEYFVGDEHLYVLGISADTLILHQEEISKDHLQQMIARFRNGVTDTTASEIAHQELSLELFQLLLASELQALQVDKLIMIPDGHLGYLPFEVLHSSKKSASYLIHDYEVRYEYSASLLLQHKGRTSTATRFVGFAPSFPLEIPVWYKKKESPEIVFSNDKLSDALQVALRLQDSSVRSGFFPLKFNASEVEVIQAQVGGALFLAEEATEETFMEIASQNSIIHLATHGFVHDDNPLYSGIAFHLAKQNEESESDSLPIQAHMSASEEDGLLHAYELYNMNLNAQLAVLSACETGIGKFQRGEGIMSLARAFKYAGCPNLVMSLWKVDDLATMELMELFYQHLKEGMEKDAALRQAKLVYLQDHPDAHPFYWASFVMIGDDQPIVFESFWGRYGGWIWGIGMVLLFAILVVYRHTVYIRLTPPPTLSS